MLHTQFVEIMLLIDFMDLLFGLLNLRKFTDYDSLLQ